MLKTRRAINRQSGYTMAVTWEYGPVTVTLAMATRAAPGRRRKQSEIPVEYFDDEESSRPCWLRAELLVVVIVIGVHRFGASAVPEDSAGEISARPPVTQPQAMSIVTI